MTKKTKILLTCIFKDDGEIEMVRRMLKSFMPHFDGLAVAITGTSGKYERLQRAITDYGGEYVMTSPDTHPLI